MSDLEYGSIFISVTLYPFISPSVEPIGQERDPGPHDATMIQLSNVVSYVFSSPSSAFYESDVY